MRLASLLFAALLTLGAARAGHADPAPAVKPAPIAVVESPLAGKWLEATGTPYVKRSAASLADTPLTGIKLLVVPLETLLSPNAAEAVRAFSLGGGKVVAVYWGTMNGDTADPHAAYKLCSVLGVRPVGWVSEPPGSLQIIDGSASTMPSQGAEFLLPRSPAVLVEAQPGTQVLARWRPDGDLSASRTGVAFLRGNLLYLTPSLFRPAADRAESRELFFWALQRVSPEQGGPIQARDRINQASGAYSALSPHLGANTTPEQRMEVERIVGLLGEARGHAAQGRYARACQTADRARIAALDLLDKLRAAPTGAEAQPAP